MTKQLPKVVGDTFLPRKLRGGFVPLRFLMWLLFLACHDAGHPEEVFSHLQGKLHQQFSIKAQSPPHTKILLHVSLIRSAQ